MTTVPNLPVISSNSCFLTPALLRAPFRPTLAPTSNALVESVHRAIGQVIRALVALYPPKTPDEAHVLIDDALATAMHACRCASSSALDNLSPGAVVFNRDMFLSIPFFADISTLTRHRQRAIDLRLLQANARRTRHEYKVNDRCKLR